MKKTVAIVKKLCEQYEGSHRTIYVDHFYTSIDLLKELDKMKLYVTGTCMKNRIPKELVITKSSRAFKEMPRGTHVSHKYTYLMDDGELKEYGLVCWKDRDMVYCLSNCSSTEQSGY